MEKKKTLKKDKGITLIALIITIVVLLILAIVTINSVQDRSIIQHAQNATNEYNKGKVKENNQLGNYLAYLDRNVPGKEPISKTESFVGCYADVDGNGSVDGIIYADLSEGVANKGNGTWGSNETYTLPKTTNLNDYYVIKAEHEDENIKIGKKPVIAPIGKDKTKARFYVMSLSDFTTTTPAYTTFYWYYNAYGNMSDYATTTYTGFGKGYDNTRTMLSKVYGDGLKDRDIWKYIGSEFDKGWYIPSKDEWAAFGGELGITTGNRADYGLSYSWSSSQNTTSSAWYADFYSGRMGNDNVRNIYYVRLGTTF